MTEWYKKLDPETQAGVLAAGTLAVCMGCMFVIGIIIALILG